MFKRIILCLAFTWLMPTLPGAETPIVKIGIMTDTHIKETEPSLRLVKKALELFRKWIALGYLRVREDGETTELLPNGSWFIQKMLTDISETGFGC